MSASCLRLMTAFFVIFDWWMVLYWFSGCLYIPISWWWMVLDWFSGCLCIPIVWFPLGFYFLFRLIFFLLFFIFFFIEVFLSGFFVLWVGILVFSFGLVIQLLPLFSDDGWDLCHFFIRICLFDTLIDIFSEQEESSKRSFRFICIFCFTHRWLLMKYKVNKLLELFLVIILIIISSLVSINIKFI